MAEVTAEPTVRERPRLREGAGASAAGSRLRGFLNRLFEPVDIASLVYFRIAFGAIMLWEVYRYFSHEWIARYFIDPTFHFTYPGFGWVSPWPGDWMYWHFAALGVLAACIALGFLYRIAAPLFFLGFSYVFLLEQARYLNHFYFVMLISFLLIFVPAHRAFSLDAFIWPRIRSRTAPTWALWALRAQVGLVFFYAGVAKLNGDWLRGEPLRAWLADRTDFAVIGRFFTEWWAPWFFSYSGMLLDLLIVPLLLWRRTRLLAFPAAVAFHVTNSQLFQIGIFPWMALGATLLFFPPDWPRLRWLRSLARRERPPPAEPARLVSSVRRPLSRARWVVVGLLAAYFAVQVLAPLRHFAYPGNVSWTEEGHQFAWHMKLRDKEADVRFFMTDGQTPETWELDPFSYLTDWQFSKMAARPDMILQFAHHLERDLVAQGFTDVEIRADTLASLNGREPQQLIDPDADLAATERTIFGADWIEPLREPLP